MSEIRVLIVEDEPLIAADIESTLNNIDFTVAGMAHNYETALQQLKQNTPDIVLLDVNISDDKDGIDIGHFINENYQILFR